MPAHFQSSDGKVARLGQNTDRRGDYSLLSLPDMLRKDRERCRDSSYSTLWVDSVCWQRLVGGSLSLLVQPSGTEDYSLLGCYLHSVPPVTTARSSGRLLVVAKQ